MGSWKGDSNGCAGETGVKPGVWEQQGERAVQDSGLFVTFPTSEFVPNKSFL